jgi:hypothetical protein
MEIKSTFLNACDWEQIRYIGVRNKICRVVGLKVDGAMYKVQEAPHTKQQTTPNTKEAVD